MSQCASGYSASRLTYWILGAVFTVLSIAVAGIAHSFDTRLTTLEEAKSITAREVTEIKWDVRGAREDICSVKADVADLREDLTHKRVFRRPCP